MSMPAAIESTTTTKTMISRLGKLGLDTAYASPIDRSAPPNYTIWLLLEP
jgi:hypothetical protein